MSKALCCLAVVLAVGITNTAGRAQERRPLISPDFSGTWAVVNAEGIAYSPLGAQFTVTQDPSSITFTGARGAATYKLDGTESRRTIGTATGGAWTLTSQARFVTHALLVTTKTEAGPTGQWEDLMVLALDSSGTLSLVTSGTAKSMDPVMITRLFKYVRK